MRWWRSHFTVIVPKVCEIEWGAQPRIVSPLPTRSFQELDKRQKQGRLVAMAMPAHRYRSAGWVALDIAVDSIGMTILLRGHGGDEGDAMSQTDKFLYGGQLVGAGSGNGGNQVPAAETSGLIGQAVRFM